MAAMRVPTMKTRPSGPSWRGGMRPFASAITAGIIGVAFSIGSWVAVAAWERRAAHAEFERSAADHILSLQTGLDEYLRKVEALAAFFDASDAAVSRRAFDSFTSELLDNHRGIRSLAWIPRVRREERGRFERSAQRDGLPGFRIKTMTADGRTEPAADRDEYFPVFYSTLPADAPVYGVDLMDSGIRRRAFERARDVDRMAATGNFLLHGASEDRKGFFVALPVYRRDLPHETLEERRRNLVGFVQGVFQFQVVVSTVLKDAASPLKVALFEGDSIPEEPPAFVHTATADDPAEPLDYRAATSGPHWISALNAGDRQWRAVVTPSAETSLLVRYNRAWIVLGAALLIAAICVAYMVNSIRHLRRLQAANTLASKLARTDPLTGLPNRRAFMEQLAKAFAGVARGQPPFAVHLLDLDEFKDINDTQGHATGDVLLKQVATRLMKTVRANDFVARFGGDEFAILQPDVREPEAAGRLAGKVVKALGIPYPIEGADLRITASVGIALHSERIGGPTAILMQADLALYRAKDDGRDGFSFHSGELDEQVDLRVNLGEELRAGIDREELELVYQTQVEISSGRIVGLEALVRWNHPTRGRVQPSVFIPIAERTGGILAVGRWVLARACRQLREWEDEGLIVPRIGVNVSGAQLKKPAEFERDVAENFARWEVRRDAIELELTESMLMEVTESQSDALDRFRGLGATIALDDFGTGFSSLTYLTTYPVHRLKIAQELIAGITTDERNAVVVRSTIRLAKDLGIEVIAEGVEREDQARLLLDLGCSHAQGYHYSRPMPATRIAELLHWPAILEDWMSTAETQTFSA